MAALVQFLSWLQLTQNPDEEITEEKIVFNVGPNDTEQHTTSDDAPLGTPKGRSGHRIVNDGKDIYLIGGFSPKYWNALNDDAFTIYPLFRELWKFNIATQKWKQIETTGHFPTELASHTTLLIGSKLLTIGGTGVPFGEASTNNVRELNLRSREWSRLACTGATPAPKYGHSSHREAEFVYVIGGTQGHEYNCDVHSLNLKTREWKQLFASQNAEGSPPSRYRHEIAFHDDKLLVLGGGLGQNIFGFEKIFAFDISTNLWTKILTKADTTHGYPQARRCHSAVQLLSDVYMCGGFDGSAAFDCLWHLNMTNMQWRKLSMRLPEPLFFHSATITEEGRMFVHGGVCSMNEKRSYNMYSIWVKFPQLKEIAWGTMLNTCPQLGSLPLETLLSCGVPQQFAHRINPTSSYSLES